MHIVVLINQVTLHLRAAAGTATYHLVAGCGRVTRALCRAGGFADSSVRVHTLGGGNAAPGGDAAADADKSLRLWGHTAAVYGVDYSNDGQLLFSASGDG